jgi:hypothetical protein
MQADGHLSLIYGYSPVVVNLVRLFSLDQHALQLPENFHLLFLLLLVAFLDTLLEVSPTADPLFSGVFPGLLVLSFTLPFLDFGILFGFLTTLFLHLGLHLTPSPRFCFDQDLDRLLAPFLLELISLQLFRVHRVLVLSDEKLPGVCNAFIQMLSLLLIQQCSLRLFEPIKRLGG